MALQGIVDCICCFAPAVLRHVAETEKDHTANEENQSHILQIYKGSKMLSVNVIS